jgi:hypothetical protein
MTGKALGRPDVKHTTNYSDTFICIAEDSMVSAGTPPPEKPENPSIAARAFRMISEHPYRYTSDDVVFTVYANRKQIPAAEREDARAAFFSKGQPCLRASDLGKKYGWGIHADGEGRIALYGVETDAYERLASGVSDDGQPVSVTKAMRSSRR